MGLFFICPASPAHIKNLKGKSDLGSNIPIPVFTRLEGLVAKLERRGAASRTDPLERSGCGSGATMSPIFKRTEPARQFFCYFSCCQEKYKEPLVPRKGAITPPSYILFFPIFLLINYGHF